MRGVGKVEKELLDVENPHGCHPVGLSSLTLVGHLWAGLVFAWDLPPSDSLKPPVLLAVPSSQNCFISPGLPKPKPSDSS